ncbi:MAG: exodeoxyribonuclease III [Bacilli bacterium]|jgi:exodeoxyribonuclease-3|nr:exodeoxyribonuclease III [Acholeplasmataceae bacterium]
MKFISWNVNGLRACMNKGFKEFFDTMDADIFAIQETKMQENQKEFDFEGYYEYWNSAEKKGYSGTLIYTKEKPINVINGIDGELYNDEGRIITLEFEKFFFITIYSPNSQEGLKRLDYRMEFEDKLRAYLTKLDKIKPIIVCGDLNVAHNEIDIKNPQSNQRNAGFTIEERTKFQALLDAGFTDTFRYQYPDLIKYTWWSYRFNARRNNVGWRIDYFLISNRLQKELKESFIYDEVMGSDHCPIAIEIF